jgi:hypothetical protein
LLCLSVFFDSQCVPDPINVLIVWISFSQHNVVCSLSILSADR